MNEELFKSELKKAVKKALVKNASDFVTARVYRAYRYSIYKHPSFGFVAVDDEHKKLIATGSTEKAVDGNARRSIDLYLDSKFVSGLK